MAKQTAVKVGIHFNGSVVDLMIPTGVTLPRVEVLLSAAFREMNLSLPRTWYLQLRNKRVAFDMNTALASYPIANGDQFDIIEGDK